MFTRLNTINKVLFQLKLGSSVSPISKRTLSLWERIKSVPFRRLLRTHEYFIKNDNMPPNHKLIYNLPFSHYYINGYIIVAGIGGTYLFTTLVSYGTNAFSLKDKDFIDHEFLKSPFEYYFMLTNIVLLIVYLIRIIHLWPLRIYKSPDNKYTALFINKINPMKMDKYNFDIMKKYKATKFSMWSECYHILNNERKVGIFDHLVEPPMEYFNMMTPKQFIKEKKK